MTLSFGQLSTPITEDQALDTLITRLTELGFSATSWQSGSAQLTICRGAARLYSELSKMVQGLLYAGLNDTATGDALTRFSASHYQNTRSAAVPFRYTVSHTVATGSGPYTINVGDLVATNGTATYRNITSGTLSSAAPITLTYEAEVAGTGGVAADGTITKLVTTLAGVTITNPTNAMLQLGTDAESDTNLRARNAAKWASLSIEVPSDHYKGMILKVLPNYRVAVDDTNPRGPGTVDIYIAKADGLATSGDVSVAQTQTNIYRAVTANVLCIAASATTINVSGTIHIDTALNTTATQAAIQAAAKAFIDSLPIGGQKLTNGTRLVPLDGIIAAIWSIPGVRNVDISSPTGDVTLSQFNVATLGTFGPQYVGV